LQVVRWRLTEVAPHAILAQRIQADNGQVVVRIKKWVLTGAVRAFKGAEAQSKQVTQLALPVAYQAGRWDDQHALQHPAQQHFTDVEARHDGLTGTGIVGQQEA
jgi:hypothetical protein